MQVFCHWLYWNVKLANKILTHSYLQPIKQKLCSFYSLLKWNCCEHKNHKQEIHLFKQLPGASKVGQWGWRILKVYICFWSELRLLFTAHTLSPWPYLMSQEVVFHLAGELWCRGGSGGSFRAPCSLKPGRQLPTAFYPLLRPRFRKLLHALQLPAESASLTASFSFLLDVFLNTGCQLCFIRWVCASSAMTTCPSLLHSLSAGRDSRMSIILCSYDRACCAFIHRLFPPKCHILHEFNSDKIMKMFWTDGSRHFFGVKFLQRKSGPPVEEKI